MKYAVIRTGGKQYRVSEGDVIRVEHLPTEEKQITFSDVLLYAADSSVMVGSPIVSDIVVSATVMGDVRGEKIRVSKFKAKARYRRVTGHRQALSEVKIDSIGSAKQNAKPSPKAEEKTTDEKPKKVTKKAE